MTIEKLGGETPDITKQNISRLAELYPECVTEGPVGTASDRGEPMLDWDLLKQALSDHLVEGLQERYRLDWPGKRQALLTANAPIDKTLRPMREESVDFETTRNLFIEGDNLDALKLLQETYLGKVKMVYIDPPYNTGKDFIYKDNFATSRVDYETSSGQRDEDGGRLVANPETNGRFHSDWLNMMYSRLKLARNLLRDDGVLIVSIDEAERADLQLILNEVFGEGNFAGEIVWKNSSKNDQDFISIQHEFFVFYTKDRKNNDGLWQERKPGLETIYAAFDGFQREYGTDWNAIHAAALKWYGSFPLSDPIRDSKHYNWMDRRGVYFASDLSGPNAGQYVFDLLHPVTNRACKMPASGWRYPKEELLQRAKDDLVHFGADHSTVPQNKTYLKDTEYQSLPSIKFLDGRGASNRLKALFGQKIFTNPKDEILLADLARAIGVEDDDVIVDLFAGSGTVAHSAMILQDQHGIQCRYVLVQYPEEMERMLATAQGSAKQTIRNAIAYLQQRKQPTTIGALCLERLRLSENAIKKASAHPDRLRLGFRAFRVDSGNFRNTSVAAHQASQSALAGMISHIKDDRTDEDLLFGALLRWGVDITLPIKRGELAGRPVWFVDPPNDGEEGAAVVACFSQPQNGKVGIDTDLADAIAHMKPLRVLFRDDGFASDSVKENVASRFKQLAPDTTLRVL